jgi:hypothetical protein
LLRLQDLKINVNDYFSLTIKTVYKIVGGTKDYFLEDGVISLASWLLIIVLCTILYRHPRACLCKTGLTSGSL